MQFTSNKNYKFRCVEHFTGHNPQCVEDVRSFVVDIITFPPDALMYVAFLCLVLPFPRPFLLPCKMYVYEEWVENMTDSNKLNSLLYAFRHHGMCGVRWWRETIRLWMKMKWIETSKQILTGTELFHPPHGQTWNDYCFDGATATALTGELTGNDERYGFSVINQKCSLMNRWWTGNRKRRTLLHKLFRWQLSTGKMWLIWKRIICISKV